MIANIIERLRYLGRQRIARKRRLQLIADLKQRRFEMQISLANMQAWPPGVREKMQEQIDELGRRIKFMEN